MEMWSPYASNYDNPIRYNDFLGDQPGGPGDRNRRDGINTGPGDADYYYREDNKGAIVSSSPQDYAQNPVKAAINDAVYLAASVTGFNSLDNYIYNRVAGQNSPKQVATETMHLSLSLSGGKGAHGETLPGKEAAPLGDLTTKEVKQIQSVVDQAERPIEVVGSAAGAERRGVGTDLPIGKGPGTRSDIDYVAPPSSLPYFDGVQGNLPSLDPKTGIIPGTGNPFIGPIIRLNQGQNHQLL